MPKESIFRRVWRMAIPSQPDCIDAQLIKFIEEMEKDSPHRSQEWMRDSMRDRFIRERLALGQDVAKQQERAD